MSAGNDGGSSRSRRTPQVAESPAASAPMRPGAASTRDPRSLGIALLAGACVGLALAWLLHRSLFEARAQSFDALIYGRSLWAAAHGASENSVLGVPWLAIHSNVVLWLLAPVARLCDPIGVLVAAQAASCGAIVGAVVFHALRAGATRLGAVACAFALAWGAPLFVNPFLFDVRPDAIGAALCALALLRIQRARAVDRVSVALLFASLLAREEFSMVIVPALVALPVARGRGLGARARWTCAAAALAFSAFYVFVARDWLGGAGSSARIADIAGKLVGPPAWASARPKFEILVVAVLSCGGLVALGWRWSVPAWPGLAFVLSIQKLPELVLNVHYSFFIVPGLCVALVAGLERLSTWELERRRVAWIVVLAISATCGAFSSAAPGGGRFRAEFFDLELSGAKASRWDHSARHVAARELLARIPRGAACALPYAYAAGFLDRDVLWDNTRLRSTLAANQPLPDEMRWIGVASNEWSDVGRRLVEEHGFALAAEPSGFVALLQRSSDAAPAWTPARAPGDGSHRVEPAGEWPSLGLSAHTLERVHEGRIALKLARSSRASPELSDRPLRVYLGGASQAIELQALSGLFDLRRFEAGELRLESAPDASASIRGPVQVHIAARGPDGTWLDVPAARPFDVVLR